MSSSMKEVLITGGAGFIGSNLAAKLNDAGMEPVIFDCNVGKDILEDSVGDGRVVRGDVRDFRTLCKSVQSVDGIIHLAAVSRVVWGYENPRKCVDVNVRGTANVLEAARLAHHKPWVIYGSSREIYGEPENLPVEESAPKRVANVYGMTKIAGENLCQQYHRNYGLNVGILRFSNVYGGVNDHLDRVTPKFIIKSLKGQEITIQGGGQVFDFTHISDTVNGIMKMMKILDSNNEPYFDAFHILTGKPASLQELVSIIVSNTNNHSEVVYGPARTYDVEKFYGDPSKARKELGFSARIGIEEGIRRFVPLLREFLGNNDGGDARSGGRGDIR